MAFICDFCGAQSPARLACERCGYPLQKAKPALSTLAGDREHGFFAVELNDPDAGQESWPERTRVVHPSGWRREPESPPWWQRLFRSGEPRTGGKADLPEPAIRPESGGHPASTTSRDTGDQSEPPDLTATGAGLPGAGLPCDAALPTGKSPAWHHALADAMVRGPQACGVVRPGWSGPALAEYLSTTTGTALSADTVRRQRHR